MKIQQEFKKWEV